MSSTPSITGLSHPLSRIIELIWKEATLLDRKQYQDWLGLWEPAGKYIVPIDATTVDFENSLNYVYDDHEMREKRVERMMAGYSASAVDSARTVRSVSRFVLLPSSQPDAISDVSVAEVSAAQILIAYKRGASTIFAADLTYRIRLTETNARIEQKIVRLVDSTDTLNSIGFFL